MVVSELKNIKLKKIDLWELLPWLWLIGGVLVMLIYHLGPGKALVDGDMGGEMILADLLNKEGDFLLSDNWYHATEIHVFFMQIIFRPLLYIWPNNWHIVRVVGTLIIYLINTVGFLLMMREIGSDKLSVWAAGSLMWPLGMWRLFLGLYGGQYLVYDFFAFYILWLTFWCQRRVKLPGILSETETSSRSKVKTVIAVVVLAFLSFAGGVNGVRETMMLFAPMCLGIVVYLLAKLFDKDQDTINWKNFFERNVSSLRLFVFIAFATFFNLIGYGYNLLVLMRKYRFQKNTDLVWKEHFSIGDIFDSAAAYLGMFGYGGDVELFSIEGICSAVGVVIAAVLVFVVIRLCIRRKSLNVQQEFILCLFLSGLVFCSIVFGMMEGMDEDRYWMPFICFGIMLFQIEADTEDWKLPHARGIAGIVLAVCIAITSVGAVKAQIERPHQGKIKNLEMSNFLDENGYSQGYTEFWLANTITEQTSGRVVARPILYLDTFEMMTWSNRIDYATTYPEGEVFFVIDKKNYPGDVYDNCMYKYGGGEVVRDDDNWLVMIFSSVTNMQEAYQTALDNGEVVKQSERLALEGSN